MSGIWVRCMLIEDVLDEKGGGGNLMVWFFYFRFFVSELMDRKVVMGRDRNFFCLDLGGWKVDRLGVLC